VRSVEDLWDFDDPVSSELRFREAADSGALPRAVALTQVARALGLQQRYDEGHAVLDEVDGSSRDAPEAAVRTALERGRLHRSAGDRERARPFFEQAAATAEHEGLEGLHLDALHMLALDLPPADSVTAHIEALALARAGGPEARRWEGSMLNNLGMAYHDVGDLPAALGAFEQALTVRERDADVAQARVARWMVGWTLRLLGRTDEALALQRGLKAELDAADERDPYVEEELMLLSGDGTSGP
jgi:tetratricopeptide (TPR) repeat protein